VTNAADSKQEIQTFTIKNVPTMHVISFAKKEAIMLLLKKINIKKHGDVTF